MPLCWFACLCASQWLDNWKLLSESRWSNLFSAIVLLMTRGDELFWHLAVPKWVNGESKWIRRSTMWGNQRLGLRRRTAAAAAAAVAVAAAVATALPPHSRLDSCAPSLQSSADSSVIWLGGSLRPSSQSLLFFLRGRGWRARWLLWYCCVADEWRCLSGQRKQTEKNKTHTKQHMKYVLYLGDTQLLKHMLHPEGTVSVTQTSFHITYICCVSSTEGLNDH